jgi:hypothetical protein
MHVGTRNERTAQGWKEMRGEIINSNTLIYKNSGVHKFKKIYELPENSRRQQGDMKY